MVLFSGLARAVGYITVAETAGHISLSGLPADLIAKDVSKIWKTSRINTYMFNKLSDSALTFPKFFAPEILYAFQTLRDSSESYTRKSSLRKIIDLMETETWLKKTMTRQPDILDFTQLGQLARPPKPHQEEFFIRYNDIVPRYNLNGYLLGSPAGTGKTYMSLAIKMMLHADCGIMVAPKHAIFDAWVGDIRAMLPPETKIWNSIDSGGLVMDADFYLIHYEAIPVAFELLKYRRMRSPYISLDECHNLNEMSAQRTQNFIQMCALADAQNVLWMSGTPLKAVGGEMIPLLRTTDPLFSQDVEFRFTKIYGQSSSRAQDILAHRMSIVTYKVPKSEVVQGKPIVEEIKVRIPNGDRYTLVQIRQEMEAYIRAQMQYYDKNMGVFERTYTSVVDTYGRGLKTRQELAEFDKYKGFIRQIRKAYDPVLMKDMAAFCNTYEKRITATLTSPSSRADFKKACSVVKYVFLVVQGEALGNILGKRRQECYTETVKYCDLGSIVNQAQKKTVVFGSYVPTIQQARRQLEEQGFETLIVFQETNSQLTPIIKRFTDEPEVNPLLATYKSLSTAVRLTMANTLIMLDVPFRDYIYDQTISRVFRMGQDTQVYVYKVVLDTGNEPNISTRSGDILEWSKQQVEAIMGKEMIAPLDIENTMDGFVNGDRGVISQATGLLGKLFGIR